MQEKVFRKDQVGSKNLSYEENEQKMQSKQAFTTTLEKNPADNSTINNCCDPHVNDLADIVQKLTLEDSESSKKKSLLDTRLTFKEPKSLEPAALKKVEEILNSQKNIVVEAFNMVICREDIFRLQDGRWLNDELVNFYGALIMDRAEAQPDRYPSIYFFNTFFYPLLLEHGYAKVERWTRRIDLFSKELVIVPIHLGAHWCCAVMDMNLKRIEYYDPLLSSNPQCLTILQGYLHDEAKAKKKLSLSGWTSYTPKDVPRQENGYDCGVFSCQYAEYRSRKSPLTFSQRHMHQFRKQMIYEIADLKLIN